MAAKSEIPLLDIADKKKEIIQELPKPQTAEEQYMYSFACTLAGVPYDTPFQSPFYRKDKYWKAIMNLEGLRVLDKITGDMIDLGAINTNNIADGAISKDKLNQALVDAVFGDGRVDTSAIQNGAVTSDKLSNDTRQRLLASENVSELNLSKAVKNKLLQSGNVKEENLSQGILNKLLGDKNVTVGNLSSDLLNRLLPDGYTGIQKQQAVGSLEGEPTNDEIIGKINEIIKLLQNAKVTA